jgi:putative ABC transport system substrate-binding protein
MRRREFITLLGGAAAWPLAVHGQERIRLVGAVAGVGSGNTEAAARFSIFVQALARLGWVEGRNLRIETRWAGGDQATSRKQVADILALKPDVLQVTGGFSMAHVLQATRTVPVVFTIVPDPVGSGFVSSLSRPGGNATGFLQFEYSLSGKWLELLKQIAPNVTRVATIWDPSQIAGIGQFAVIQSVAPSLGIEVFPFDARDMSELERGIAAFASSGNGGMVVTATAATAFHREPITALAARHRLPAVYANRDHVVVGGLISYAADFKEQFRQAASYVDRILKGEKPADLPVQAPTKYELVINLKTAKALGFDMPPTVLARADEVIE